MTNKQLKKLKQMTVEQLEDKYLPMLKSGKINSRQYSHVLSLAKNVKTQDESDEVVKTIIEAFGGEEISEPFRRVDVTPDEPIEGDSQKERILKLLQMGGWHDTVEIMNRCYGIEKRKKGICRISARIYDLKKDGWEIESRKKPGNKTIQQYKIKNCE